MLHNFEPPATRDEVGAAALQYVRKVSGTTKPSKANEAAFARAVADASDVTNRRLRPRHERTAQGPRGRGGTRKRSRREALRPRRLSPPSAGSRGMGLKIITASCRYAYDSAQLAAPAPCCAQLSRPLCRQRFCTSSVATSVLIDGWIHFGRSRDRRRCRHCLRRLLSRSRARASGTVMPFSSGVPSPSWPRCSASTG